MKRLILPAIAATVLINVAVSGCKNNTPEKADSPTYITVGEDGNFYKGDSVYNFVGVNLWYGAILGSEGQGGDRERLAKELDLLKSMGIDNLRVLVGGDGCDTIFSHIRPVLQTAPGVYNDTILDGLDYMMAELEKRDMHVVLYLNNAWEWSGGYGSYLEWAGMGEAPEPSRTSWPVYCEKISKFNTNDSAKAMAQRHVNYIVSRTNRYTNKPYTESPALMAWEIANEPRPFASDSATFAGYTDWILSTAALIKSLDPNHLVATGSEGMFGCEGDLDLWTKIHNSPEIDYSIIHLWPYNWSWLNQKDNSSVVDSVDVALKKSIDYITIHADKTNKPLVLEEFGYPRDNMEFALGTPTTGRDRFYEGIFDLINNSGLIQGCNIWSWGGYAQPAHERWQPWDEYTGDPSQEAQGLNSVFVSDTTTLNIIKAAINKK